MIESFIKKVSVKSKIYSGKAEDTVVSVRICDVRKRGKTVLSITPSSENYYVNDLPISGLLQCEQEVEELISLLVETQKEVKALALEEFSKHGTQMLAGRFLGTKLTNYTSRFLILLGDEVIEEKLLTARLNSGEVSPSDSITVIAKEFYDLLSLPSYIDKVEISEKRLFVERDEPEVQRLGDVPKPPKGTRGIKDGKIGPTWGETFIKWLRGDDL